MTFVAQEVFSSLLQFLDLFFLGHFSHAAHCLGEETAMEVAGVVVSTCGFAIQLADSARKLHDFWQSVVDAPSHLKSIVDDLKLLENILRQISDSGNSSAVLQDALLSCQKRIDALIADVICLEPAFTSNNPRTRKWTSVKAAWGSKGLERSQAFLDSAKSTLVLGQNLLADSRQRNFG